MNYIEDISNDLDQYAIAEIARYGFPPLDNYNDVISVALELGKRLHANLDILKLSSRFLDIKLGEANERKKSHEHPAFALDFAKEFLSKYPLDEEFKQKVFNCIIEHHGKKFSSLEAEICANADCYKFLVPRKILRMFYEWRQRGYNFEEIFLLAQEKVDEKWKSLTLDVCKKELEASYNEIVRFLDLARRSCVSFVVIEEEIKKLENSE